MTEYDGFCDSVRLAEAVTNTNKLLLHYNIFGYPMLKTTQQRAAAGQLHHLHTFFHHTAFTLTTSVPVFFTMRKPK